MQEEEALPPTPNRNSTAEQTDHGNSKRSSGAIASRWKLVPQKVAVKPIIITPTYAGEKLRNLSYGYIGPLGSVRCGWRLVLEDQDRRSFISHKQSAFPLSVLDRWYEEALTRLSWSRPQMDRGLMPRNTAWLTNQGCICPYRYGGTEMEPAWMEDWFIDITRCICKECGLTRLPDSCNVNYYENGKQYVNWHTDNEALFQGTQREILIISLSLGSTRDFEFRIRNQEGQVQRLPLLNGDICVMEGLCQKYYSHRVPQSDEHRAGRINFTWRWIVQHHESCPNHTQPTRLLPVFGTIDLKQHLVTRKRPVGLTREAQAPDRGMSPKKRNPPWASTPWRRGENRKGSTRKQGTSYKWVPRDDR